MDPDTILPSPKDIDNLLAITPELVFQWRAIYEDGTSVCQNYFKKDEGEHHMGHVDINRVKQISLEDPSGRLIFAVNREMKAFIIYNTPLILDFLKGEYICDNFRRNTIHSNGLYEVIYVLGLKSSTEEIYLFINPDGTFKLAREK